MTIEFYLGGLWISRSLGEILSSRTIPRIVKTIVIEDIVYFSLSRLSNECEDKYRYMSKFIRGNLLRGALPCQNY
jgi:hypothetical protein